MFSCPVMSTLWSHELKHARPPCPSLSAKVCLSSCPLHQWCDPAISSSDALYSFCPHSFSPSGTFPVSELFALGEQNTGNSVLYKHTQYLINIHNKYLLHNIYVCIRHTHSVLFAAATAKSLQSCPTLCDPIDGSPPGSPVPGVLQARTLEWVAIAFSHAWKWKVKVKLLSRVSLNDTMDCSLPGSSVHGIFLFTAELCSGKSW